MTPEELKKAKKVARLIIGYLNRDLSPMEKEELDDWLSEDMDNVDLFERLTDEQHLEESMAWFRTLDKEVVNFNRRHFTIRVVKPLLWIAAAVLVLAIGIRLLYNANNERIVDKSTIMLAQDSVAPGNFKAVLITASGDKVSLGNQMEKEIALGGEQKAKDNGERLVYGPGAESSENTLQVPAGGMYQVVLPDGTKVWLNSVSELKYPTAFVGPTRKVELEGEGYFEVAKNSNSPFEVHCGRKTIIQVTGTQFNVSSYSMENMQRVTLLEGGINLLANRTVRSIKPGEEGIVLANGNISVSIDPNSRASIAWTKGLFSFRKTSIEEVMRQFERWYNVQVIFEGRPVKQFTGNIPMKSSINSALQMLEISGNVHFTLSGKTVTVRP